MHGQVPQDSQFCVKNHRMDVHGPGRNWQESKRPQGPTLYGQKFGNICQKRRSESKSKSGLSKNGSSTMVDNRMVLISLILTMNNSTKFSKNARRKFEVPMPAAMLCKTRGREYRETCSVPGICKIKYACIVEADEFTRKRMEGTLQKGHEDNIAGKGINSLNHCNMVHKFIPMPQKQ